MYTHPDITRSVANDRYDERLRDAERSRVTDDGEHESLLSRLRERLPHTSPRRRRVFRPARAS